MKLYKGLLLSFLSTTSLFAADKMTRCWDKTFAYNEVKFACFDDRCEAKISGSGQNKGGDGLMVKTMSGMTEVLGIHNANGAIYLTFAPEDCKETEGGSKVSCSKKKEDEFSLPAALLVQWMVFDDVSNVSYVIRQDVHPQEINFSFAKGVGEKPGYFHLDFMQWKETRTWDITLPDANSCYQESVVGKSLFPDDVAAYFTPKD